MKYSMYSVRDIKVGFDLPYCDMNDNSAMRGFAFSVNDNKSIRGFAPKDYSLYKVGEYDVDTGKIKTFTPVLICEATDVLNYGE